MTGQTAEDLFRAGQEAYDANDFARAHVFWQQAAYLAPKDERVWRALLLVVETEEDRRACLKNLLRIDPHNTVAARQLQTLDWIAPPSDASLSADEPRVVTVFLRAGGRLALSAALIGLLFLLGLVIGVLMNNLF